MNANPFGQPYTINFQRKRNLLRALRKRTIREATEGEAGLVLKLGRGGRRHCNDDSKDQSDKQFSTLGARTGKEQLTGHAERQISSVGVLSL